MYMKKKFYYFLVLIAANFFIYSSCHKSDYTAPPAKTKTELLTQSSWRFNSATANGTDISNQAPPFDACRKDNIITFTASGGGNVNEGPTSCSPPKAQLLHGILPRMKQYFIFLQYYSPEVKMISRWFQYLKQHWLFRSFILHPWVHPF